MKTKLLIILLCLLFTRTFKAQNQLMFNTAISWPNYNSLIPALNTVNGWSVSLGATPGTYVHTVRSANPGWCAPTTNSDWICYPFFGCASPYDHSCTGAATKDLWFRIDFTLSSPTPLYVIDWEIFADDKVVDIFVNGSNVWTPNGASFSCGSGIQFKWCTNWVSGNNYIIIHVQSVAGSTGLKVISKTPVPAPILGNNPVCPGVSTAFSVTPISGATNYFWTMPATWSPGANNSAITTVPGTNSGVIQLFAKTGIMCYAASTLAVSAFALPTISIVSSATSICQGSSVLLGASGANSYTWIPGNVPGPILMPSPPGTTNYTVTGKDGNGCKDTETITIVVRPLPVININPTPAIICPGIQNTLTASGTAGNTYTWVPNLSNPLIGNLTPGNYVVNATGTNGCFNTANITLAQGPSINLSTTSASFCTNASTSTVITASSTFPGTVNYAWQFNNVPVGAGPSINVSAPGSYVVLATSGTGCGTASTSIVTVISDCCSQPTTGLTLLTSLINGYTGGSYLIDQNITLSGSTAFLNSEVLFKPGVKITVPAGMQLYLGHAHLYACGINMWDGIEVQDGGEVAIPNQPVGTTLIEDAIVAIDAPGASLATLNANGLSQGPFSLHNVIFNKNHTGIQIRQGDQAITHYLLFMIECVFTSRNLPFTPWAPANLNSWPNTDMSSGGLRFTTQNALAGLASPYALQGYAPANLKLPYAGQPGETGIKIVDVGNQPTVLPSPGIGFGLYYLNGSTNYHTGSNRFFNLFDGLRYGIDVEDANLTISDNVFQNMRDTTIGSTTYGGIGIRHRATGLMNTRLDLYAPDDSTRNYFWNCRIGVEAENAYEVNIERNIFRSDQVLFSTPSLVGSNAVLLSTNRFNYNIKHCQFSNIHDNVRINATTGAYDVGGITGTGTYAGMLTINQNYISRDVVSQLNPVQLHSGNAISISGLTGSNWYRAGFCNIYSNKLYRVYRGIYVEYMQNYFEDVSGNWIELANDIQYPSADQYGIYANANQGSISILENVVYGTGGGASNSREKLIRCADNTNFSVNTTPIVRQNHVLRGFKGFSFEGIQPYTEWLCNSMYSPMRFGMALEANASTGPGYIGPQGSSVTASGNLWVNNWGPGDYTYCDGSNTQASTIYVEITSGLNPTHAGSTPYNNIPGEFEITFIPGVPGHTCFPNSYPTMPNLRSSGSTAPLIPENKQEDTNPELRIYPNPSKGQFYISSAINNLFFNVRIMDLNGKLVYVKNNIPNESPLDISELKASVYMIEIQNSANQIIRKKLVKTE